jgi:hypothetical protein
VEGGEVTTEETADRKKATPTEDLGEETAVKWRNERKAGEMTET